MSTERHPFERLKEPSRSWQVQPPTPVLTTLGEALDRYLLARIKETTRPYGSKRNYER